jgi:hypothetical protein
MIQQLKKELVFLKKPKIKEVITPLLLLIGLMGLDLWFWPIRNIVFLLTPVYVGSYISTLSGITPTKTPLLLITTAVVIATLVITCLVLGSK